MGKCTHVSLHKTDCHWYSWGLLANVLIYGTALAWTNHQNLAPRDDSASFPFHEDAEFPMLQRSSASQPRCGEVLQQPSPHAVDTCTACPGCSILHGGRSVEWNEPICSPHTSLLLRTVAGFQTGDEDHWRFYHRPLSAIEPSTRGRLIQQPFRKRVSRPPNHRHLEAEGHEHLFN